MTATLVILGSTRGRCIQASLTAIADTTLDARVACVVSDKADAPILQRAKRHNIPAVAVPPHTGESRMAYDTRMMCHIDKHRPDMVLMVGYMRIVSPIFCRRYKGRVFNVHPSLLPAHAGLMDVAVHQSVLDSGDSVSGCTIHRVTEVVDSGENVIQYPCAVLPTDTVATLKARVQQLESQAWITLIQEWKNYVR